MIMLTLSEGEVKSLMNLLLKDSAFDFFELRNLTIQSFARLDIEGTQAAVQDSEGLPQKPIYCGWEKIRPYALNFIKGSEKPALIRVVFSLPQDKLSSEFPEAQALFVNIIFENNVVSITTGTSLKKFSLDRSVEQGWDDYITSFFKNKDLKFQKE